MPKITIQYTYAKEVVPPRCRKPRVLRFDGTLTGSVREVPGEQAPVAIRSVVDRGQEAESVAVEYRLYEGKLWTSMQLQHNRPCGFTCHQDDWDYVPLYAAMDLRSSGATIPGHGHGLWYRPWDEEAKVLRELRSALRAQLVIDGVWHREAGEPRYVAMTFGLGGNDGGTSLTHDDKFNPNLARRAYFSLLQREAGIAYATQLATERGDTKSVPIRGPDISFDVLIPEAIRVNAASTATA